ncbi:hypothetical protein, partial [Sphingopyxis sp.]|uniref:hypothetical protein n=1 Tax=Sphingopyxis sp. TaxID=1908224 RepID=UPI002B4A28A0
RARLLLGSTWLPHHQRKTAFPIAQPMTTAVRAPKTFRRLSASETLNDAPKTFRRLSASETLNDCGQAALRAEAKEADPKVAIIKL